jgi:hypothetical protein
VPWWQDDKYVKGTLSKKRRFIRIVNTLTSQDDLLEVCIIIYCAYFEYFLIPFSSQVATEETLEEIRQRYLKFNLHAGSYAWVCSHLFECICTSRLL